MNLPALARQAITAYFTDGERITPSNLSAELSRRAGVFVSLHASDGTLRGCIGTIEPTTNSLANEVINNAIAAATRDNRFTSVRADELSALHISVDVVSPLIAELNPLNLNPKQYGIVIATTDGRQGVLLPDVVGVSTIDEQLRITREKAGIASDEPINIWKFTTQRFEE